MKAALVIPVVLCLAAASPPPLPPVKRVYRHAEITQGMGASKLIAKIAAPAVPRTNIFVWRYPPSINPSNFFWKIETATSPRGPWSVLITNASGAQDVTVNRTESLRVYRLSVNLSP